jgi:hypothetical protein
VGRPPGRQDDDLAAPTDGEPVFTREQAGLIHVCLGRLKPVHREVLVLRFVEGMTYEQIAEVVGCPVGTVRSRIHHAKSALQHEMEASDDQYRDVGEELLRQAAGAKPPPDPLATVEAVSRRQRRRLGLWAGLTVFLWILTGGYCIAIVVMFLTYIFPRILWLVENPSAATQTMSNGEFFCVMAYYLLYSIILWQVLLVAAAGMTVVFILKSRQATLRQIQASLNEISRQIKAQSK